MTLQDIEYRKMYIMKSSKLSFGKLYKVDGTHYIVL